MISQEEEKMIEAVGWTLTCHSPMEMQHEDGSTVEGVHPCKIVIEAAIKEYHEMKREEAIEAERVKKAEATKSLNLESINGREIIKFLNEAISNYDSEIYDILCDCSVSGFKFQSQEVNIVEYRLHFTGVYNNWGTDQDIPNQRIVINEDGVVVKLDEPFDGDGSDEAIEEVLTNWIKTHKFSNNSKETFDGIVRDAYETLGEVGFENKEELRGVIKKLEDAYTYMK